MRPVADDGPGPQFESFGICWSGALRSASAVRGGQVRFCEITLRKNLLYDGTMDVREPIVAALESERQSGVIKA